MGERIRRARISKGLTQQELGELVGVQKSAIAKYESGRVANIKTEVMTKLSRALDITQYELISGIPPAVELAMEFNFDDEEAKDAYLELSPEQQLLIRYIIREFKRRK